MVRIRLSKTGAKNAPSYRIVAIDSRRARESKALEILGFYNPSHRPEKLKIKKDRIKYWKSVGAQTSAAVEKLIAGKYKYVKYEGSSKKEGGKGEESEKAESEGTSPKEPEKDEKTA